MKQFLEFVDRKQRESKKHLKLMEKLLRKGGLEVHSHIEADDDEPYIFVKSPTKKLSFDGIRIYEIGEMVAYRIQKEEKTQPFGKSYSLNLEDMFNDFMSENMKEKEAGKKVIEGVISEIKKFFNKSERAEEEMKISGQDGTGLIIKTGGSDYSSAVLNRM
jgi:hypothetical protein